MMDIVSCVLDTVYTTFRTVEFYSADGTEFYSRGVRYKCRPGHRLYRFFLIFKGVLVKSWDGNSICFFPNNL